MLQHLALQPDPAQALENYRLLATGYDGTCRHIEPLRQRAIDALRLVPGETVFDLACGTGPALPRLARAVGAAGRVIGVEMSPQMAAQARRRLAAEDPTGAAQVIESAVESMPTLPPADAVLLSYTHDVLQSPAALERLLQCAKPGARIVILGMKTLPWLWGWPLNLFNLYRARRYLTTFRHLQRPWQRLEQRGVLLHQVHSALWGSAYIAAGILPGEDPPQKGKP